MMDAGDAKRNRETAPSSRRWVGVLVVAAILGGALLLSLRTGNNESPGGRSAFFSPVESNPWLRPGAKLPTLRHVAISTGGQTAVAAGAGAFLWSGDGGSDWSRVPKVLASLVGDVALPRVRQALPDRGCGRA